MSQTKQGPETAAPLRTRRSRRGNLIHRTVNDVLSFIRNSVYTEEMADRRGLLQAADPRAKLVALGLLLGAVLATHKLDVLASLYLLVTALAVASKIPFLHFLKRVWVFMPLFAGIIALPILFSPVSPGRSVLILWRWADGTAFAVTDNGLWMASVLVLRVATSVSLAVLLVLTTRWAHLLKALRVFGVPRVFILTLEMTYRYIFLLIGIIQSEHMAKESRTIRRASLPAERHWATSRIGHLFLRSRQMGEEVYLAMLARGYSGEAKLLNPFRLRAGDVAGLCACLMLLLLVLGLNRIP